MFAIRQICSVLDRRHRPNPVIVPRVPGHIAGHNFGMRFGVEFVRKSSEQGDFHRMAAFDVLNPAKSVRGNAAGILLKRGNALE